MADAALNIKMTANTTELRTGLADAAKAAQQFSTAGKSITQAGATMSNGLKQVGTAASGLKGKLGGFASEFAYFADELQAGIGPVDALASRIPLLIRGIGGFHPVVKILSGVLGGAVGGLIAMGAKALLTAEQVKTLSQVGSEVQNQMKLWEAANKSLEASFTQLGNTSNAAALQIRRGFMNEMELSRKALLDGFKQLPVALGAEMEKFQGVFDPAINLMKDLSPWVQKTLVGFRTLGGAMQATTPAAAGLIQTLSGLKSLGASQQQLDAIAIGINNVNKAAQSKDPAAYAVALQDAANRLSELLSALGVAPGEIQRLVKEFYAGADAASAMAGQVSKLTQTLIDLAKARNALNSASSGGMSLGGFASNADMDLAVRKYRDLGVTIKQQRADMEGFWTAAKTGADTAARALLNTYVPAKDRVIAKQKELKQAYATLGVDATAEDTRNYNAALAETNAQLDKLASGGGGGGGGGSLGRAAKGIKATGDAAQKAGQQMKTVNSQAAEFGEAFANIAQSLGSGVIDALFSIAEGSKSAKEAFSELAKSMLKQIAQLIFQMLVLKPLMSLFPGGGAVGGLLGGVGMASRSLMHVNRMSIGSSLGNAAIGNYTGFNLTPAISQFKSASLGNGLTASAQPAQQNVTVNNYAGAQIKTRQNNGQVEIDVIMDVMADALVRGGNKVDAALQRAYGARRVGY
jgi:hypothetical protein